MSKIVPFAAIVIVLLQTASGLPVLKDFKPNSQNAVLVSPSKTTSKPEIQQSANADNCHPDQCGCEDDFSPICASDLITYGNKCLLKCNQKCQPKIVQIHEGYCGRIFFRDMKTNKEQAPKIREQAIVFVPEN